MSEAKEAEWWGWLILFCAWSLIMSVLIGCGEASDGCDRSAYETERPRYRCTPAAELQTLECGEWVTLDVCRDAGACSPVADGCR